MCTPELSFRRVVFLPWPPSTGAVGASDSLGLLISKYVPNGRGVQVQVGNGRFSAESIVAIIGVSQAAGARTVIVKRSSHYRRSSSP